MRSREAEREAHCWDISADMLLTDCWGGRTEIRLTWSPQKCHWNTQHPEQSSRSLTHIYGSIHLLPNTTTSNQIFQTNWQILIIFFILVTACPVSGFVVCIKKSFKFSANFPKKMKWKDECVSIYCCEQLVNTAHSSLTSTILQKTN